MLTAVSSLTGILDDDQQITRAVSAVCGIRFEESSVYTWAVLCGNIESDIGAQYQGDMAKHK